MWLGALFTTTLSVGTIVVVRRRPAPHPSPRVLVDVRTPREAVRLVRVVCRPSDSTERLAFRLERLYRAFPPSERTLRHLSHMQQSLCGSGNEDEFCVVVAFATAMTAISEPRSEAALPPPPTRRSAPPDIGKRTGARKSAPRTRPHRGHEARSTPSVRPPRPPES